MSATINICTVPDDVKAVIKKFRFQKATDTSAIIFKIDRDTQEVIIDEHLEECTIDELVAELPEQDPRFVLVNYKYSHADGRVSFPLYLVFLSPAGCNPQIQMLYAGSKNNLVKETGSNKDFEIRDLEDMTEELFIDKAKA